ncbi:hypothetical protein V496_03986 [Pseudogymnoascus sp. VKM F-4515 (FW-2607)]|nr:hypothetical protein V496_03986 [Pseudogymnoascus sp. VKM F-4515 (FW-2607)]
MVPAFSTLKKLITTNPTSSIGASFIQHTTTSPCCDMYAGLLRYISYYQNLSLVSPIFPALYLQAKPML